MKLAIASDLHLEFEHIRLDNTEGADVLILAGDICTVKHYHSRPNMEAAYHEFFRNVSEQFKHVLYVVGNHEHYNYLFIHTVTDLKAKLAEFKNIHVLDNETFDLDNFTFVGSTLWTDMNIGCPQTMDAAKMFMPDFKIIKYFDGANYYKYSPAQSIIEHNKSVGFIRHVIRNCQDKDNYLERSVVVITHHAPSAKSIHKMYEHETLMNGAFYSNLDHIMELADNVKLWVHGHMHNEFDYNIGITNVVCNPRGYPKEGSHGSFKLKYVEI